MVMKMRLIVALMLNLRRLRGLVNCKVLVLRWECKLLLLLLEGWLDFLISKSWVISEGMLMVKRLLPSFSRILRLAIYLQLLSWKLLRHLLIKLRRHRMRCVVRIILHLGLWKLLGVTTGCLIKGVIRVLQSRFRGLSCKVLLARSTWYLEQVCHLYVVLLVSELSEAANFWKSKHVTTSHSSTIGIDHLGFVEWWRIYMTDKHGLLWAFLRRNIRSPLLIDLLRIRQLNLTYPMLLDSWRHDVWIYLALPPKLLVYIRESSSLITII